MLFASIFSPFVCEIYMFGVAKDRLLHIKRPSFGRRKLSFRSRNIYVSKIKMVGIRGKATINFLILKPITIHQKNGLFSQKFIQIETNGRKNGAFAHGKPRCI